VDRYWKKNISN
jgi:hypothetical protein